MNKSFDYIEDRTILITLINQYFSSSGMLHSNLGRVNNLSHNFQGQTGWPKAFTKKTYTGPNV